MPRESYLDLRNVAFKPCMDCSAARLRGFEDDLHLEGEQFNTLLSILYVGYILMQIPSYIFLSDKLHYQSLF